jgi:hypothetical protein
VVVMVLPTRPRVSGDTPPRERALRRRGEDAPSEDNPTLVMTRINIEEVDGDEDGDDDEKEEDEEEKEEANNGDDDADDDVDDVDDADKRAAIEAAKVEKDKKWHANHSVPFVRIGETFEVSVDSEQSGAARTFERTGRREAACVVCRESDSNYKTLEKHS